MRAEDPRSEHEGERVGQAGPGGDQTLLGSGLRGACSICQAFCTRLNYVCLHCQQSGGLESPSDAARPATAPFGRPSGFHNLSRPSTSPVPSGLFVRPSGMSKLARPLTAEGGYSRTSVAVLQAGASEAELDQASEAQLGRAAFNRPLSRRSSHAKGFTSPGEEEEDDEDEEQPQQQPFESFLVVENWLAEAKEKLLRRSAMATKDRGVEAVVAAPTAAAAKPRVETGRSLRLTPEAVAGRVAAIKGRRKQFLVASRAVSPPPASPSPTPQIAGPDKISIRDILPNIPRAR